MCVVYLFIHTYSLHRSLYMYIFLFSLQLAKNPLDNEVVVVIRQTRRHGRTVMSRVSSTTTVTMTTLASQTLATKILVFTAPMVRSLKEKLEISRESNRLYNINFKALRLIVQSMSTHRYICISKATTSIILYSFAIDNRCACMYRREQFRLFAQQRENEYIFEK